MEKLRCATPGNIASSVCGRLLCQGVVPPLCGADPSFHGWTIHVALPPVSDAPPAPVRAWLFRDALTGSGPRLDLLVIVGRQPLSRPGSLFHPRHTHVGAIDRLFPSNTPRAHSALHSSPICAYSHWLPTSCRRLLHAPVSQALPSGIAAAPAQIACPNSSSAAAENSQWCHGRDADRRPNSGTPHCRMWPVRYTANSTLQPHSRRATAVSASQGGRQLTHVHPCVRSIHTSKSSRADPPLLPQNVPSDSRVTNPEGSVEAGTVDRVSSCGIVCSSCPQCMGVSGHVNRER